MKDIFFLTEKINKIALSLNNDKGMETILLIEIYAYETN